MNLTFARINLAHSNYKEIDNYEFLEKSVNTINLCNKIYKKYCDFKCFDSVVPIFDNSYLDDKTDIIGYFDKKNLVAFSLVKKWDAKNAECVQFAWDYENPRLRLGIRSLENECSLYKRLGYEYLYLGLADEYKAKIDGYEKVGKL